MLYIYIHIYIYKYSDTKTSFYSIYRGVPDWEVVVLWPGCKNHHIEEDPQSPQLDAESSDSDANHQSSCQNTEPAGSADWWFHSPKTTPMKCLREIASMYLSFIEPGMSMSQTGSPMRSPDEVSAVGPAVSWSVVSHRCWWVKLDPRWGPDEVSRPCFEASRKPKMYVVIIETLYIAGSGYATQSRSYCAGSC